MLNFEISRFNYRHMKPTKDLKNKNENKIKTVEYRVQNNI